MAHATTVRQVSGMRPAIMPTDRTKTADLTPKRSSRLVPVVLSFLFALATLVLAAALIEGRRDMTEPGGPWLKGFFVAVPGYIGCGTATAGFLAAIIAIVRRAGGIGAWITFAVMTAASAALAYAWIWPVGWTLVRAVYDNDAPSVQRALDCGVSVNTHEIWGFGNSPSDSALNIACLIGNVQIVELLLDHGAIVQGTAIVTAAGKGHADVVRALLNHDAPLNGTGGELGGTAFMAAAVGGHFDLADELLAQGARPRDGSQLAWLVVNDKNRLEYLAQHGVALDATSGFQGRTALMAAAEQGYEEGVQFLLSHGCDPHRRTSSGSTALSLVELKINSLEKWHEEAIAWSPDSHTAKPDVPGDDQWKSQLAPYLRIRDVLRSLADAAE